MPWIFVRIVICHKGILCRNLVGESFKTELVGRSNHG